VGTEILIMGDFNETIGEFATDANHQQVQSTRPCHAANHGIDGELETYSRGNVLDYAFGSQLPNDPIIRIDAYRTL
jgi:hypothetical protein